MDARILLEKVFEKLEVELQKNPMSPEIINSLTRLIEVLLKKCWLVWIVLYASLTHLNIFSYVLQINLDLY